MTNPFVPQQVTSMTRLTHDPTARLDYTFPWGAEGWLAAGEIISSYTVTAPPGVTVSGQSISAAGDITVWVRAPNRGEVPLVCRIVTNAGREDKRTILLEVRDR